MKSVTFFLAIKLFYFLLILKILSLVVCPFMITLYILACSNIE